MSQFDIYRMRGSDTLLVDCQTIFLDHLPTRFVVPLLPLSQAPEPADRFNPILRIEGEDYHFAPQYAASVRACDLQATGSSLVAQYEKITVAIDFLVGDF